MQPAGRRFESARLHGRGRKKKFECLRRIGVKCLMRKKDRCIKTTPRRAGRWAYLKILLGVPVRALCLADRAGQRQLDRLFEKCIGIARKDILSFCKVHRIEASLASWLRCRRFRGQEPQRANGSCGQATKGAWWMSRRDEAMKDVVGCDKPREAVKQVLILGSPNGETRRHCASRWRHRQVNA